jgi:hypothetical protein
MRFDQAVVGNAYKHRQSIAEMDTDAIVELMRKFYDSTKKV